MLNTIAIISLIVSILSASAAKLMEIFRLDNDDLVSILLEQEVKNNE